MTKTKSEHTKQKQPWEEVHDLRAAEALAKILRRIDQHLAVVEISNGCLDEMVELVAESFYHSTLVETRQVSSLPTWKKMDDFTKKVYRRMARKALKALSRFMDRKRALVAKTAPKRKQEN